MNETAVRKERAVLAGLSALSMEVRERSSDVSMEELASLVERRTGCCDYAESSFSEHPQLYRRGESA